MMVKLYFLSYDEIKGVLKRMKKIIKALKKLFVNIWLFLAEGNFLFYLTPFVALITLPLIIYLAINIPNNDLKEILQVFAQLNVTIAIGIGTLEIAIKAPDGLKAGLIKEILGIISISVFSFFISHFEHELIQRVYICLSGFILVFILLSAFHYVKKVKSF